MLIILENQADRKLSINEHILQPPFHDHVGIKGDILLIGHYKEQPENITLEDYREFQQIVIELEGRYVSINQFVFVNYSITCSFYD